MKFSPRKQFRFGALLGTCIFGLTIFVASAQVTWQPPTQAFPNGQPYPPIDMGDTQQIKIGIIGSETGLCLPDGTGAVVCKTSWSQIGSGGGSGTGGGYWVATSTGIYFVSSTSRVGIGTVSPGYTLDVMGNAHVSSSLKIGSGPAIPQALIDVYSGATANNYPAAYIRQATPAPAGGFIYGLYAWQLGGTAGVNGNAIGTYSASTGLGAGINSGGVFSANSATGGNRGLRITSVPAGATNYALYSDAVAQSYFAGPVGLGTTSPTSSVRLDILQSGSGGNGVRLYTNVDGGCAPFITWSNGTGAPTVTRSSARRCGDTFMFGSGDRSGFTQLLGLQDSGDVQIGTANAGSIFLKSNSVGVGSVNIGDNGIVDLNVTGNVNVTGGYGGGVYNTAGEWADTNTQPWSAPDEANPPLSWWPAAQQSQRLSCDNSTNGKQCGNSIYPAGGSVVPTMYDLFVGLELDNAAVPCATTPTNCHLRPKALQFDLVTSGIPGGSVYAKNGYFSGTAGVGTTNPLSTFDVNGGVAIGTYAGTLPAGANNLIVSGNVGIGTANPGFKLDVNGTLNAAGNTTIGGTLNAMGNTTLSTLRVTGDANVGGSGSFGGIVSFNGGAQIHLAGIAISGSDSARDSGDEVCNNAGTGMCVAIYPVAGANCDVTAINPTGSCRKCSDVHKTGVINRALCLQ